MSTGRLLGFLASTIVISSMYACADVEDDADMEDGIAETADALKGCKKKGKEVVVSCDEGKLWRCDTPKTCKPAIQMLKEGAKATVLSKCASESGYYKVKMTKSGKKGFVKGTCLKLASKAPEAENDTDSGEPEPVPTPWDDAGTPSASVEEPPAPTTDEVSLSEEQEDDEESELRKGIATEDERSTPETSSCAAATTRSGGTTGAPWLVAAFALPLLVRRRRKA